MSVDSILAAGRARRQLLMRDAVTIVRPGPPVFDASTGAEVAFGAPVYTGIADVKAMTVAATDEQAGEREISVRTYDVALPFGTAAEIRRDDQVRVDTCDDESFVGAVLTVVDVQHSGRRTARHLIAEDRA